MIVLQSTYDAMRSRALTAEFTLSAYVAKYRKLLAEWNDLVDKINELGGDAIFKGAPQSQSQFTPDELQKLILLCHPDKHDGKPMANEITAKLIAMKNAASK